MPETLTRKQRKKVENFHKIGKDVNLGLVAIDTEKCTGCAICTKACAASCLEVADEKCRLVEELPLCMSCGDCVAICPEKAIELKEYIRFNHHFCYLDRGEPSPPRKF